LKKKKKISVVIPNFNHGHFLESRIKNFFKQTYSPYEIIIIDDCSTDDSYKIINEIKQKYKRVKVIRNKKNLGVETSFNRGIRYAKGDYLYPCSADDLNDNDFFFNTIELLEKYKTANICMTIPGFYYHNLKKKISKFWEVPLKKSFFYNSDEILKYQIKKNFTIWGHCCLYRSSFLKNNSFNKNFKWYHDWFLLNKETLTNGIVFVPKTFCYFRVEINSYSSNINTQEKNKVIKKLMLHIINNEKKNTLDKFIKSMVFQTIIDNPFYLITTKKIRVFFTTSMMYRIFFNMLKKKFFQTFSIKLRIKIRMFCYKIIKYFYK
jgi:glycosyltransferase involved in cell wall biosynthesis